MFIRIQCQATWICQNTSIFIQRQAMWNHTLQYLQVKADFGSSLASHCVVLAKFPVGRFGVTADKTCSLEKWMKVSANDERGFESCYGDPICTYI
jgi:hypothetical protein